MALGETPALPGTKFLVSLNRGTTATKASRRRDLIHSAVNLLHKFDDAQPSTASRFVSFGVLNYDGDMSSLIDTHAHLCDPVFDPDLPEALERSRAVGISGIIAVGESMEDAQKNLQLSSRHSMIHPAAGLYPTVLDRELALIMCDFIRTHRVRLAAIGEVGLDHWVVKSEQDWEVQLEIFRMFIALSKELNLPLNVHSRSAGRPAVAALLEAGASRVQMHAFDGKYGTALAAVEAGYFFSVPPSIVRSDQKRKLVKQLPLSCLMIETDSPVLGPVPQERNEPANAVIALKEIAGIKGLSEDAVKEAVIENTLRLYGSLEGGSKLPPLRVHKN